MLPALHIRTELPEDQPFIHQLLQAAFGQPDEAQLVDRLRSDEAFLPQLALLAEQDKHIVGHIAFSQVRIEEGAKSYRSLALAPMAVQPAHQKLGIGSLLVRAGLDRARQLGHQSVIVLGHANYYPRFGFQPASRWNIRPPFEVADEVFMALELEAGALEGISGKVRYAEAFGM